MRDDLNKVSLSSILIYGNNYGYFCVYTFALFATIVETYRA